MENYTDLKPFRFWCQSVLPLVYDDSLSYYELLCKVVAYINKIIEDLQKEAEEEGQIEEEIERLKVAFVELKAYVDNYFDNLDVQEEINAKLDEMAADGTLEALIDPVIRSLIAGIEQANTYVYNGLQSFKKKEVRIDSLTSTDIVSLEGLTIDNVTLAGKTLREIFIIANMFDNSPLNSGSYPKFNGVEVVAPENLNPSGLCQGNLPPVVTSDYKFSHNNCLKCNAQAGNETTRYASFIRTANVVPREAGHRYFQGYAGRLPRTTRASITSGFWPDCHIGFVNMPVNNVTRLHRFMPFESTFLQFAPFCAITEPDTTTNAYGYLGIILPFSAYSTQNAYFDELTYIDLTALFGENIPEENDLYFAFNIYLAIITNKSEMAYNKNELINMLTASASEVTNYASAKMWYKMQEINAFDNSGALPNFSGYSETLATAVRFKAKMIHKIGLELCGSEAYKYISTGQRKLFSYNESRFYKELNNKSVLNLTDSNNAISNQNTILGYKGGTIALDGQTYKNYFMLAVVGKNKQMAAITMLGAIDTDSTDDIKYGSMVIAQYMAENDTDTIPAFQERSGSWYIGDTNYRVGSIAPAITRTTKPIALVITILNMPPEYYRTLSLEQLTFFTDSIEGGTRYNLPIKVEKNSLTYIVNDTTIRPVASTIKMLVAITALDYFNPADKITIKAEDIKAGSGDTLRAGDVITFDTAMWLMLMNSDNDAAEAIGRSIGEKAIAERYQII